MSRYRLAAVGVVDTGTGALIRRENPAWLVYESWLALGNVPDPPDPPAPAAVEDRRREISARVNGVRARVLEQLTVTAAGNTFDASTASYANLLGVGLLLVAGESLPAGFTWRTTDNRLVALTAAQVRGLVKLMVQAREAVYRRSWALKDEEIASSENPDAVDIESGWPGVDDPLPPDGVFPA